ncbi:activating signal cointegrator 1 complex subunit [Coemansia spiralis]|uniref:Activating signal cointegrator 1 complex subunit n=2 Tax=Coemansia TaxID=4863 RepID=A0A9W8G8X2_9FUNG|nr:activating signal cointegrator 1 complex subunit [Coemansia umbellata]KAJ2621476.1 activating signal cointegrator 1 complex subunit [Coemansia sp. RSA 1358]KAJ2677154.1 activating signal cointegrator 1 complex subunit [Coemansia spiralis]
MNSRSNGLVNIYQVGSRRYRVRTSLCGNSTMHSQKQPQQQRDRSERKTLAVPRQLHKYIIGSNGSMLAKLTDESQAKITVPQNKDNVEIEGLADQLAKAEDLISKVVSKNMRNIAYTHFISLPISDIDIQRKIGEFQREARSSKSLCAADCSSFVEPASLHVTIGMLRLLTPADVTSAVAFLKTLQPGIHEILANQPLVVRVGGLEAMEADRQAARIIYAKADDDGGRLQRVCRFVREAFDNAGYIDEKRELKIHITVIRAKEAKGAKDAAGAARERPFGIDATALLREFGQAAFGACRVGQMQLARRFRFTESGAYASEGFVALP